jgi:hypothetical protein
MPARQVDVLEWKRITRDFAFMAVPLRARATFAKFRIALRFHNKEAQAALMPVTRVDIPMNRNALTKLRIPNGVKMLPLN